jgi:pimeloyl-ACP methyl ester carboxylesterase
VDLIWEEPSLVAILKRLGGFARNVWMDPRGAGSSDALTLEALPNLDTWNDDLSAVMADVGSSRVALAGFGAAGCPAMFFAASFPERVSALVLFNAYARFVRGGGYPCGLPPEMRDRYVDLVRMEWGTSATLDVLAPSMKGNEHWCRWFLRSQRLGTSRAGAGFFFDSVMDTNVLDVLGSIQAPTLVVHRRQNPHIRVEHGRYLAEHIPGCSYKELPGSDHAFCAGDTDALVDEIEEFLTGVRPAPPTERVRSAIERGAPSWTRTTRSCELTSSGTEVGRSRPRVTACSPPSTHRLGRFGVHVPSAKRSPDSGWSCGRGSTPARSRYAATM